MIVFGEIKNFTRWVNNHCGELRLVFNEAYEGDKLAAVCKRQGKHWRSN